MKTIKIKKSVLREWDELSCNGEIWYVATDIAYYLGDYDNKYLDYAEKIRALGDEATIKQLNTLIEPMLKEIGTDFGEDLQKQLSDFILWEDK